MWDGDKEILHVSIYGTSMSYVTYVFAQSTFDPKYKFYIVI